MPIYEYRCKKCGFQKEFLQRLSDAPLKDCPECGKPALSKMVTAAGFHLKGTGWYATDFKSSGAKPAGKPAKPAEGAKPAESTKPAEGSKPAESSTSTKETPKTDASSSTGATPAN